MPLKTHRDWIELINSIKGNNPGWGAGRITRELKAKAEQVGRTDVPGDRTVGRILAEEWGELSDEDRARYREFHWPESMECNALPWEASAAALELLGELDKLSTLRPSIEAVRLFWRVCQAAPDPDAPFWLRMGAAMLLMRAKRNQDRELARAVQWLLAYRPWRDNNRGQYIDALKRWHEPIPAVPKELMPLYRITEPVASYVEFLKFVRECKLEWLVLLGPETSDVSQE